jgi:3-oxoadipate enol-lactonase
MLLRTPPEGYAASCAAVRDADLRPVLSRIRAPTLVVAGARDEATPPLEAWFLADRIPGARLVELEAAHLSNVEAAEAFTAAVRAHLEG